MKDGIVWMQYFIEWVSSTNLKKFIKFYWDKITNETEKAGIYGQLGLAKYSQAEHKEAITFYEKTAEIYKKKRRPSSNHRV